MAKKKNLGGRPTVMTDEVVTKLEYGFSMGLNDTEASLYAGISRKTLYEYIKLHPEFSDRKEELKESVKMHAKMNLGNSVSNDKNVNDSKWVLERLDKKNYSTQQNLKQEVDAKVDVVGGLYDKLFKEE